MKLFGELCGALPGPILVIGGGPSAPRDLELLRLLEPKWSAVISANEHGLHQDVFKCDYAVCCDGRHGEKKISMEKLLKGIAPDVKIITPGAFADYRLAEWTLNANTGLTAIAVAVFMGGAPVVVTGIDFYRMRDKKAPTYFHDPDGKSNSNTKTPRNFADQIRALQSWIGHGAPVRPMSGPLLEHYPPFTPLDRVAPISPPRARYLRTLPVCMVQCRPYPPFSLHYSNVDPGRVFAMSPNEARGAIGARGVKLIETHPAADGTELPEDHALHRRAVGYLPALAKRDLAKRGPQK